MSVVKERDPLGRWYALRVVAGSAVAMTRVVMDELTLRRWLVGLRNVVGGSATRAEGFDTAEEVGLDVTVVFFLGDGTPSVPFELVVLLE
jgi:hypothetical protein